jgi:DNA repair protein RecO (recombination protein O)
MPPIASDALVLRTYKLGETSKVVVLLTRERGKLRAVAKGARGERPRYQSALEPLSEVRASLHGRQGAELYRLGACELLRSAFRSSERGLEAALSLSYFAELIEAFSQEGEADDAVYRLAKAVLAAVALGSAAGGASRYLEAWLLRLHGIYPQLDRCAGCGATLPAGERRYHEAARGFACGDCGPASGPVLSAEACDYLRRIFKHPPAEIGPAPPGIGALEGFQHHLITRHLERDLRSRRVLRDVEREVRG